MISINGVVIPTPKSYEVGIQDIDGETNRNAAGYMCRDRITTKRKLTMEWAPLSQSESSTLLNAVAEEFFSCTFLDPQQGQVTKTMYAGDRTTPMLYEGRWSGLKMNFIER